MTDNVTNTAIFLQKTENYSKAFFEMFQLNAIEKSEDIIYLLIFRFAVFITIALSVITISFGITLWIDEQLTTSFHDFFMTGSIFTLLLAVINLFR